MVSEKVIVGLFIAFIIVILVLYGSTATSTKPVKVTTSWTLEQLVALDQLIHYMIGTDPASLTNEEFYTWLTTHISQQLSFKELMTQTISDRIDTVTGLMIQSNYLGNKGNWNHLFKKTQIEAMKRHILGREDTCYSCIFNHIESMYDPSEYIQGHARDMIERLYPICETC